MTMIKKLIGAAALLFACTGAYAAEGGYPLDTAPNRVNDLAALQNGAKLFVNYCLNCHSASSMRYNKLTEIGLTDEQIRENLLFTGEKVGDLMTIAMTPADAKKWFGTIPPDLSIIARAKSINAGPTGADYIYTYMRTFYRDTSKATGWNNLVFPNVGMPHVFWQLQGPRELTTVAMHEAQDGSWERVTTTYDDQGYAQVKTEPVANFHGHATLEAKFKALDPTKVASFDNGVADLTAFLSWMAEPHQLYRKQLGVWVLLFLGLFLVVAWRLNASYWKHVR
ncbi:MULTISPECIES: cytochrome c1 [unclassified Bordetella]|uniref:cytochrome c1 n=1 Tax=unclassified Bordetella TaxID=2630031 RepID=UPI00132C5B9F|nr:MULTISPECIES: cytochrome c1 [unclassified Bordetella]MVW72670.1 cytochrome c1 [Bordetella sp. 15P40C-2]MVW78413.1 cytochrome c1 [Bordetella sp. 02P26C-1]